MIEYSEQHQISEDFLRENKEHFFGSPIWKQEGPETIGSVITMKRQLYSTTTSYGRGKLILISLHTDTDTNDIFSLKIPEGFPIDNLEQVLETVKSFNSVEITLDFDPAPTKSQEGKINISLSPDISLAQESDFMHLLYSSLELWLELNDKTVEELTNMLDLQEDLEKIENFLEYPNDPDTWIDFNLGFDLESFLYSE